MASNQADGVPKPQADCRVGALSQNTQGGADFLDWHGFWVSWYDNLDDFLWCFCFFYKNWRLNCVFPGKVPLVGLSRCDNTLNSAVAGLMKATGRSMPERATLPSVAFDAFDSARARGDLWTLQQLWTTPGFSELPRTCLGTTIDPGTFYDY